MSDQPMDQFLAEYFGTGASTTPQHQPSSEDSEKTAQAELFVKLAAEKGIDVKALNDAQVEWLWEKTFPKEASAGTQPAQPATPAQPPPPAAPVQDKLAAAQEEHSAKLVAAARFKEAEEFGKIAAHSYVSEIKKIAQANGGSLVKAAEFPPPKKDGDKDDKKKDEDKKDGDKDGDKKPLPPFMQEKKGSFDLAAAELAQKMLVEAKHDEKIATARLNAVLTLGLQESAKTAAIQDFNEALRVRALEFCETAGYPVDWTK